MKRTRIKPMRSKPRPGRLKGKDLERLRFLCWVRDHGRCVKCSKWVDDNLPDWHDQKYHMAHIKAKRIGGDSLENVRTLCGKCHRAEHNGGKPWPPKPKYKSFEEWLQEGIIP